MRSSFSACQKKMPLTIKALNFLALLHSACFEVHRRTRLKQELLGELFPRNFTAHAKRVFSIRKFNFSSSAIDKNEFVVKMKCLETSRSKWFGKVSREKQKTKQQQNISLQVVGRY